MEKYRARLRASKRIVLKIGTQVLLGEKGEIDLKILERLAQTTTRLIKQGKEIIIVSSGAIATGRTLIGMEKKNLTLPEKQALASLGQPLLMHYYEQVFYQHQILVGQVLLTHEDFSLRERYLHSRNTLEQMLKMKILPIINENDAVAVAEIKFGDNDLLAALVAGMLRADLLVIFSVVPGLCTQDPLKHPDAKVIPVIKSRKEKLFECMVEGKSELGSGGMESKLKAVDIALSAGIMTFIGSGKTPENLERLLEGKILGTLFLAEKPMMSERKHWLLFAGRPKGEIKIDQGAVRALVERKKSLLPRGVIELKGKFFAGELVRVVDEQGREIARGLVNFSASDLKRIKGLHSEEIAEVLGVKDYEEVIHRDNLVISKEG